MFKKTAAFILVSACAAMLGAADIFLVGDSTCASYNAKLAPLTGWGQVLQNFCQKGTKVHNHAISGASSKSFIDSKAWAKMLAKVKKGDFVVIQFGHNDSKKNNEKKYTSPGGTYDANLKKFISEVRAKGAFPMIATSISRANFAKDKIKIDGLAPYCASSVAVAKAENVPLVDLNGATMKLFNTLGKAGTEKLFMCSTGIEKRKNDRTHLNQKGAAEIAKLFVDGAKTQKLPLAACFK